MQSFKACYRPSMFTRVYIPFWRRVQIKYNLPAERVWSALSVTLKLHIDWWKRDPPQRWLTHSVGVFPRGRSICSSCCRLWGSSAEKEAEPRGLQVCLLASPTNTLNEQILNPLHCLFPCVFSSHRQSRTHPAKIRAPPSLSRWSIRMNSTPSWETWVRPLM